MLLVGLPHIFVIVVQERNFYAISGVGIPVEDDVLAAANLVLFHLFAAFGEDAGSFGAAALAAVGAGVWESLDHVKTVLKSEVSAIPEKNAASTYASIIPTYKTLLDISSQIGEMLIK